MVLKVNWRYNFRRFLSLILAYILFVLIFNGFFLFHLETVHKFPDKNTFTSFGKYIQEQFAYLEFEC